MAVDPGRGRPAGPIENPVKIQTLKRRPSRPGSFDPQERAETDSLEVREPDPSNPGTNRAGAKADPGGG